MAISSTARMLSNAPINIVHPYIFNVNIHFTVSHCSAGDSHVAALLGMTVVFDTFRADLTASLIDYHVIANQCAHWCGNP